MSTITRVSGAAALRTWREQPATTPAEREAIREAARAIVRKGWSWGG